VREAVFNALHSMGAVEGARVLDLFAGSGAMGIEALSRGAAEATFVERSRSAVDAVRGNLQRCDLGERATVVQAEALSFLRSEGAAQDSRRRCWDLAILDPPYAFDRWGQLLTLVPAAVVVIESDREIEVPPDRAVVRARRYGATVVIVAEGHPPLPSGGSTP
jgi:16S rRNA (guanine966-N2)-methyltransferase